MRQPDVDDRGRHGAGHVLHREDADEVAVLQAPDEQVDEVDGGELDEGGEDKNEAHYAEDVQCCNVANL